MAKSVEEKIVIATNQLEKLDNTISVLNSKLKAKKAKAKLVTKRIKALQKLVKVAEPKVVSIKRGRKKKIA